MGPGLWKMWPVFVAGCSESAFFKEAAASVSSFSVGPSKPREADDPGLLDVQWRRQRLSGPNAQLMF